MFVHMRDRNRVLLCLVLLTLWRGARFVGACGTVFAPPAAVAVDGQAGAKLFLHTLRDRGWRFPRLREGSRRGCRLCGSWGSPMAIAHAWAEAIVQWCGLSVTGLGLRLRLGCTQAPRRERETNYCILYCELVSQDL